MKRTASVKSMNTRDGGGAEVLMVTMTMRDVEGEKGEVEPSQFITLHMCVTVSECLCAWLHLYLSECVLETGFFPLAHLPSTHS